MNITRCENGHFYDEEKSNECPHCQKRAADSEQIPDFVRGSVINGPPRATGQENPPGRNLNDEKTTFGPQAVSGGEKIRVEMGSAPKDEKTVGLFRSQKGYDPVTGWLVCMSGAERGRDYRLHMGRNFIGRAMESDIALMDDAEICRKNHCSIVYEPQQSRFMIVRGDGETKINGEALGVSRPLVGDDVIEMGASYFTFIAFCREDRTW